MRNFLLVLVFSFAFGCDGFNLENRGNEGETCFNNDKCNDSLTCIDGICTDTDNSGKDTDYTENDSDTMNIDEEIAPDDNNTSKPDEDDDSDIITDNETNDDDPVENRCNLGEICWNIVPTQQTRCFNETGSTGCPDPGDELYGQDGNYSSGNRGFENIKTGDKYFVFDNLTEMLWNKKSSETKIKHSEAVAYCEALNTSNTGEKNNWRLPHIHELVSLINFDESLNPITDGFYFPDIKLGKYWTIDELSYGNYYFVDFSGMEQFYTDNEENENYAICVSSDYDYDTNRKFNRWTELTTGEVTVKDNLTGLVWQKPDDFVNRIWKDALSYCENLEFADKTDWRLPNVNELHSLATYGASHSEQTTFPDLGTSFYWTSTTNANEIKNAWIIEFTYGILNPNLLKSENKNSIRTICVR